MSRGIKLPISVRVAYEGLMMKVPSTSVKEPKNDGNQKEWLNRNR